MNERSFILIEPNDGKVKAMHEKAPPIHPRKLEIVEAAIRCFLEQGYHQTGVRDIARRAGISLGNLYNHFKGKEALLAFIADLEGAALEKFIAGLTTQDPPLARLTWFTDSYASFCERPENALLGIEILAEALRNPKIADVFADNRRAVLTALQDCLSDGVSQGAFAPGAADPGTGEIILDAIEGHGLRAVLSPQNKRAAKAALTRFVLAAVVQPAAAPNKA